MKIFPPTKALIVSINYRPDTGLGVSAHGEMIAVTALPPEGEPAGVLRRLTLNYDVWGEEAIERVRQAFGNREEIDLSIGL